MKISESIRNIIEEEVKKIDRPDLFRSPIYKISSGHDEKYKSLKTIIGEWHYLPEELLPDVNSVISFFVPFTKEVTIHGKEEEPVSAVWGEAYVVLNALINKIGSILVDYLQEKGFSAKAVDSTHNFDTETLKAKWSHRSAATIAGFGSFGPNRMLITEKGSAGRFGTVLTSANLEVSNEEAPERCLYNKNDSCLLCIKLCPVSALTVDSFEKFKCYDRLLNNAELLKDKDIGFCDVCGKCITNCSVAYIE